MSFPAASHLAGLESFATEQQHQQQRHQHPQHIQAGSGARGPPPQGPPLPYNGGMLPAIVSGPGAFPPMRRPSMVTSMPLVEVMNKCANLFDV
jgi:hypothetical protein